MNIRQVKEFFEDKKNTPCPLTERLIKAGYQQTSGGYINLAKKRKLTTSLKNTYQVFQKARSLAEVLYVVS